MFDTLKKWLRKAGVAMGLIKELQRLEDVNNHQPINVLDEEYMRMELNKDIYKGFVPAWHHIKKRVPGSSALIERDMLTFGMGKTLANEMASLIYNEKCYISVDDEATNQYVQAVLEDNDFQYNFQRYLEYAYALGGMAMKLYIENDQVKIGWAKADSFVPLGNNAERVDQVLFTTKTKKDDEYFTLLEWNERDGNNVVITNELYVSGTPGTLGTKTALSRLYPDLEEQSVLENMRSLFTYIRSADANNINLDSPLGISIYENCHDQLKFLDYMLDFWFNEFELGKRRIAVNKSMVQWVTDPYTGAERMLFDPEETVYVVIDSEEMREPKDMAVQLRTTDVIGSINALLNIIAMKTGFSAGTFSFDGQSVKTATEVISENSKTYRTKNSNENIVESALVDLVESILDLSEAENIFTAPDEYTISVTFDDSIAQDRDSNFNHYMLAVNGAMMPKIIGIQRAFGISKEEAAKWVELIDAEKKASMPVNADMASFINLE